MKTSLTRLLVGLGLLLLLVFYSATFQVSESEKAVLTRFGKPVRELETPGLYFKYPWPVEAVRIFDTRLDFRELRLTETLTKDKRNVIVPLYLAWRVEQPRKFLEGLATIETAERVLENIVTSAKNTVLGQRDFEELVSMEPGRVDLAGIEADILENVAAPVREQFGLEVREIGIRRVTFPESNTPAVFERMRAERAQFASKFQAEGRQRADEIRVGAESEAALLVAEAEAYAEGKRGLAEAEAARLYSEAHSANPDFYRFLLQLDALRAVADGQTSLLIDGAQAPFHHLVPGSGIEPTSPATPPAPPTPPAP